MQIDTFTLFITLFLSYIAKDLYDMFLRKYVLKMMNEYKKFLEKKTKI